MQSLEALANSDSAILRKMRGYARWYLPIAVVYLSVISCDRESPLKNFPTGPTQDIQVPINTSPPIPDPTPNINPTPNPNPAPNPTPNPVPDVPYKINIVGDIAQCGNNDPRDTAAYKTAQLARTLEGNIITLGDNRYLDLHGERRECWEQTWQPLINRLFLGAGNHDVEHDGGADYYRFFGDRAGPFGLGYYGITVGNWRIIVLNSNSGYGLGSAQDRFLDSELAANKNRNIMAIYHHPVHSSGPNGHNPNDSTRMKPFLRKLYENGVDIAAAGHDHSFQPGLIHINSDGIEDRRGFINYVVGTGGANLTEKAGNNLNFKTEYIKRHGILQLTLYNSKHDANFYAIDGYTWDRKDIPIVNAAAGILNKR